MTDMLFLQSISHLYWLRFLSMREMCFKRPLLHAMYVKFANFSARSTLHFVILSVERTS